MGCGGGKRRHVSFEENLAVAHREHPLQAAPFHKRRRGLEV
jgi:RNase adaptor protein for sRNA GlmZ degradation